MNLEVQTLLPICVVVVIALVAAGTDLWNFRIPNLLTVPFLISGLTYHTLYGQSLGLTGSVWGVVVATLPYAMLYVRGGMGAGDLKLLAGVGAWLGPWFTVHVLIVSGLATGCYSAGLIILDRRRCPSEPNMQAIDAESREMQRDEIITDVRAVVSLPDRRSRAVPFGAMVALGVIGSLFWLGPLSRHCAW